MTTHYAHTHFFDKHFMRRRQLCDDALAAIPKGTMQIGDKIRAVRRALEKTQAEFADLVGVNQSTVARWEAGKQAVEFDNLRRIAELAGQTLEEFTSNTDASVQLPRTIKVIGSVAAGLWSAAAEWDPSDQYDLGLPQDERFPNTRQYALEVSGPSMNLVYPEGSFVICVSIDDMSRDLKHGDRVLVYRRNTAGEYEATLKELVIQEDKGWLWPKSSHPDHQQPVPLDDDGTDEVQIAGLVIGSYRPE